MKRRWEGKRGGRCRLCFSNGIKTKSQENISNIVLFRAILGPFQQLLKPFSYDSGGCLNHKNNKQQENEQFYTQNGINRISNQLRRQNNARNVGKVENRQTDQQFSFVLSIFFFFLSPKHLVIFSCQFFSINLKLFSPVFRISHWFSPITGRYFDH